MSSNEIYWPFDVLGFDEIPTDKREVRRAYARLLKQIDQATDPQGFQTLRTAYEAALQNLQYTGANPRLVQIVPPPEPLPPAPKPEPEPQTIPAKPSDEVDQVGWNRVEELCEQVSKHSISETHTDRIRRIINDPVFEDIQATDDLEYALYAYLSEALIVDDDGSAAFQFHITDTMLEMIDQRFGWFSDSVSFQNRNYVPTGFMIAMSNLLDPAVAFQPPKPPSPKWISYVEYLLGSGKVWLGWFGSMIVILSIAPPSYAPTIASGMIAVPILLIGGNIAWHIALILWYTAKALYFELCGIFQNLWKTLQRIFERTRREK